MAIELRLKNGDNILWYRPKNIWDQTKDCMILVPWLPHYLDKYHPFIKTCADANIDLFVIRYTGSRENKGEFNLSNNIVDIDKTIDFVEQWRAISLYDKKEIKFNYKKIYLLWFSYWALPLIFSQSKDNLTKILVCDNLITVLLLYIVFFEEESSVSVLKEINSSSLNVFCGIFLKKI